MSLSARQLRPWEQDDQSGRLRRLLEIEGVLYIQWDNEKGPVTRRGPSTAGQPRSTPRSQAPETFSAPSRDRSYDNHSLSMGYSSQARQSISYSLFPRSSTEGIPYNDGARPDIERSPARSGSNVSYHENRYRHSEVEIIPATTKKPAPVRALLASQPSIRVPEVNKVASSTEPLSYLSPLGREFIEIKERQYETCKNFIYKNPKVFEEKLANFQLEAVRLAREGKFSMFRTCVQQLLLFRKCSSMSDKDREVFFDQMMEGDSPALTSFLGDFDVILKALKQKSDSEEPVQNERSPQPKSLPPTSRGLSHVPEEIRHAPEPTHYGSVHSDLPLSMKTLSISPRDDQDRFRRSRPDPSLTTPRHGLEFRIYSCCNCGDGPKTWGNQRRCVNCNHTPCSSCRWTQPSDAVSKPDLAPPIQAHVMHSGPQRIEKGTLPGNLGTSNDESLETSDIAGRTTPNRDNQCANFTSSPGGKQVRSVTLPIRTPPGAPDAALLHSDESDHVIQNSSGYANESLSGVKSDSSVIANTPTLVENDLVSCLELSQVNSRVSGGLSKSSDFNSESRVEAVNVSAKANEPKPVTLPKELSSSSLFSNGSTGSSTKIEHSLGNEGGPILEVGGPCAKRPSTIQVRDTKCDGISQEVGIPTCRKLFNAQLFEDHDQRFMRGWQSGAEAQDGDDASSRSSSEQASSKEPVTLGSQTAKANCKRRINEASKGHTESSEDDENTRKRRVSKRPQKTAEEKQRELRCTEFAAGRQTTAKCLTYSTRNVQRLKSDHLTPDHNITKHELEIARRQPGETEALLWKRLFMKRNPEWLDSHTAIPSPYYSANYESIQESQLFLPQQADRLRLPESQSRNNEALPDISGQDQVDSLPTRHFGAASDRPLGNTTLSSAHPQLGESDHQHYAPDVEHLLVSPERTFVDTTVQNPQVISGDGTADAFFGWTNQNNLPSSQVSSTMPSSIDTGSSSHSSLSSDPGRDRICRCKMHTDTCDRSQFVSGAEKCVSCQGFFSWTANAMSCIALTTEGESLCRCKWHNRACRKLQEDYDARMCDCCMGWFAFSEQASKLIKMVSSKRTIEPCTDQTEDSEFSEFIDFG